MNLQSEANTQAEFYYHAKRLGMKVALEVNDAQTHFLAIVEAKRDTKRPRPSDRPETSQLKRYRLLGVTVEPLLNFKDAEPLAIRLKQRMPFLTPVAIDYIKAFQGPLRSPNRKPRY